MGEAGFTLRAGAAGAGTPAADAGTKTTTSRPAAAKSVVDRSERDGVEAQG